MGNVAKTVPFLLQFPSKELRTELHKETLDASCEKKMTVSEYIVGILRQRKKVKLSEFQEPGEVKAPFFLRFYDKNLRDTIKAEAKASGVTMGQYMVAILEKRDLILH
jgi:hypothetical protein